MDDTKSLSAQSSPPAEIAKAIIAVMKEVSGVTKTGAHPQWKGGFASMSDVLAALQPALAEHGLAVVMSMTELNNDGKFLSIRFSISLLHESGKSWLDCAQWIGMARAHDEFGANRAASQAEKYLLLKLFHIPTEDDDDGERADAKRHTNKSDAPKSAPTKAAKATPPPKTNGAAQAQWWAKGDYQISRIGRDKSEMSWTDWSNKVSKAIESAPNAEKLKAFWKMNEPYFTALEDEEPSMCEFLRNARDDMLNNLEGVAA